MKQEQSRKVNLTNHSNAIIQSSLCSSPTVSVMELKHTTVTILDKIWTGKITTFGNYSCHYITNFNIHRLCYKETTSPISSTPSVSTLGEENLTESCTESNGSARPPPHTMSPHLMISILAQIYTGYLGNVLTNLILFYFHWNKLNHENQVVTLKVYWQSIVTRYIRVGKYRWSWWIWPIYLRLGRVITSCILPVTPPPAGTLSTLVPLSSPQYYQGCSTYFIDWLLAIAHGGHHRPAHPGQAGET